VLATIQAQGKLTDELKQRILACFVRTELEDIYLPFKPKRKTKATSALEKGLGPLAEYIWEQTGTDPVGVFAQQLLSHLKFQPFLNFFRNLARSAHDHGRACLARSR
jgi:uncharacterized protein